MEHKRERPPIRFCPVCHTLMPPCDYSPIYGYSWIHRDNGCVYSKQLLWIPDSNDENQLFNNPEQLEIEL